MTALLPGSKTARCTIVLPLVAPQTGDPSLCGALHLLPIKRRWAFQKRIAPPSTLLAIKASECSLLFRDGGSAPSRTPRYCRRLSPPAFWLSAGQYRFPPVSSRAPGGGEAFFLAPVPSAAQKTPGKVDDPAGGRLVGIRAWIFSSLPGRHDDGNRPLAFCRATGLKKTRKGALCAQDDQA